MLMLMVLLGSLLVSLANWVWVYLNFELET